MKKLIAILFAVSTLYSCAVSKTLEKSKKTIKGDWTLSQVKYSESGTFNVNLLDDAPTACFEGSSWHFVPNNDTGTYTFNKSECAQNTRYFKFTIDEVDKKIGLYDFLLKPTDEKWKSEYNQGFRLKLTQLSNTSMQWSQTVNLEGKPFIIYMNFTKKENK